jgi:hypothetical protein
MNDGVEGFRSQLQKELGLGKSQTAWSEQAKALAQQSLNAGLQAAQNSTALLLEEAARMKHCGICSAAKKQPRAIFSP